MRRRGVGARRAALGVALLLVGGGAAPDAAADAYRYTDDRGVVHFTDNPAAVPGRFRDDAERIETREAAPEPREANAGGSWLPDWSVPEELAAQPGRAGAAGRMLRADAQQMEGWLDTWGMAFVISSIPWSLITFGAFVDALLRRRFLWAAAHILVWLVSVPIYLVARLDALGMPQRLGLLVLWTAPFVVGALALAAAARTLGGTG